jgi:hypothetical protein
VAIDDEAQPMARSLWARLAAFVLVLAATSGGGAVAAGDIVFVYVNRCATGCTIVPGFDDALTGRSSILGQQANIAPPAYDDNVFNATVACMQDVLAPFEVEVVTTMPSVPHHQLIVAGTPAQAGFPMGVTGVAPYTPGVTTLNAIGFAFAGAIGPVPDDLCWIALQQLGGLYGLDRTFHCPDIMSVLATCPIADKTFTDFDAPCGEFSARACMDGPATTTQNSFALMLARTDAASRVFRDSFENQVP